jgi:hypothetical protein
MQYLLLLHSNNGYANAPRCYIKRTLYIAWHVLVILSPGVGVKRRDSVFSLRYELNVSSAWTHCGRYVPAVHVVTHKFMRLPRCYCLRQLRSRSGVRGFIATCSKNPYGCSERAGGRTLRLSVRSTYNYPTNSTEQSHLKATGSSTSQDIPHILWSKFLITMVRRARHLPQSWAKLIQSTSSYPLF